MKRVNLAIAAAAFALSGSAVVAAGAQAAAVGLGTADGFSVLGGSGVTNTGPTILDGDLGVSPGSAVSGFPPGIVAGAVHVNDAVALQAQSDLVTAYDDAAARSATATVAGDLAGLRLTSGVYASATSLGLSGDLTLDAQGDPDAVFVFKAGSTLTTGPASRVLLIGGAQACNVFWQVGSSATLGTASRFTGNILALTSVSLTTGATVDGRALARNGAVTLDSNVFTRSACTPPAPGGGGTGDTGGGPTGGTPGAPTTTGAPGTSAAAPSTAPGAAPGTGVDVSSPGAPARRGRTVATRLTPLTTLILTRPASRIACDSARLRGSVRAGAAAIRYRFQFGTTKHYGRRTASGRTARGARVVAVHAQARPLLPGTTYHYRLVSVRPQGRMTIGADRTFSTRGPRACATKVQARAPRTAQGFTG